MKAFRIAAWSGTLALTFAGFFWAPQPARADGLESMQTIKRLADAKTMTLQLKDDALKMQQFAQMDVKWEAHAASVAQMRGHIAAMNAMVDELKTAEITTAPWEKTLIDRVGPFMEALAMDNENAIDQFDEHPSLFGTPAAKAYLAANAESATYLTALVQNFLENGTLRQTIQDYDEPEDSCSSIGFAYPEFDLQS